MKINSSNEILNNTPLYEFAEFSFDAKDKVLFEDNEIIQLAPKACELLDVFIKNAGKIISKEELMNLVWADSFVEEANLTHHISALRKALGEDNERKFIETIPRKGYRFVAPITTPKNDVTEIVISERTELRALEEFQIEPGENPANLADSPSHTGLTDKFVEKNTTIKRVFAALVIVSLISLAAIFGGRWFSAKPVKTAILPQAIVSKRLMPDMDTINPAISPDGKFAVFSLLDKGQSGVWQRNIQTGEMSQFTPDLPLSENLNGRFRYSPDGVWIYFIRSNFKDRRTTLERMSATGGSPQIVLADIDKIRGDFGISPDGGQIAYIQEYKNLVIVDVETKTERTAAKRGDNALKMFGNPGFAMPAWSPDGKVIIVGGTSEENGRRKNQLIEINALNGEEKIIPLSEDLRIYQIEWLADATGLLVTAAETTGVPQQICHISLPDGKITTLTSDDSGFNSIRLSKDSRTMIADKEVGSLNIWIADAADLSRRTQVTKGGSAIHGSSGVAISSESQIFYTSPSGGSVDIWSVMSDGGGQKQLTKNTGKFNSIYKISPDGRYLIFDSIRNGNNQIWRINADGGNPVQLSNTGQPSGGAEISPDGKWVYFISSPAGQFIDQIYKVSIEGGESVPANERNYQYPPRFSPDGKLLIFRGKDENNQPISAIIEAATGKIVCPAEKLNPVAHGIWAKDSRHLIYTESLAQELWQYDVFADKREKIVDFRPATIYNFAVSPDGKKYVFSLGNISDETILFTNYLSEAR